MGPTVCSTAGFFCAAGMDVASCVDELGYTCGAGGAASLATTLAGATFGDACGGHASPCALAAAQPPAGALHQLSAWPD